MLVCCETKRQAATWASSRKPLRSIVWERLDRALTLAIVARVTWVARSANRSALVRYSYGAGTSTAPITLLDQLWRSNVIRPLANDDHVHVVMPMLVQ